jgi:hypothetical protein
MGLHQEARAATAEVMRFQPQLTIAKFLNLLRYAKPDDSERMAEGLRKAGFPE